MNYTDFILLLDGYRSNRPNKGDVAESGRAFCPSHQLSSNRRGAIRGRTLSVALSSADAILLHCHAGCSVREICASLGVDESDLFPEIIPHVLGNGKGVGASWYPAMSLADAIEAESVTLIQIESIDDLHQKIQHIGQLVREFKTVCRAAARKGGAA